MKFRFLAISIMLLYNNIVFSDIVVLKRGDVLGGKVTAEDEKSVTINYAAYKVDPQYILFARMLGFDRFYTMQIKDGAKFSQFNTENIGAMRLMTGTGTDLGTGYVIDKTLVASVTKTETVLIKMNGAAAPENKEMVSKTDNSITIENIRELSNTETISFEKISTITKGQEIILEDKSPFVRNFHPTVGILVTPFLPIGEVGSVLGMGFGASLFGEVYFSPATLSFLSPLKKLNISLYGGLSAGFSSFSGAGKDFTASVSLIPILAFTRAEYNMKLGTFPLNPYLKLGFGLTMASLNKQFSETVAPAGSNGSSITESAMDSTLMFGLGAMTPIGKRLNIYLDGTMTMLFEKVSGQFIVISIGASYNI